MRPLKYLPIVGWTHRGWGKYGAVFIEGLNYWPGEGHMIFKHKKTAIAVYGKDYVMKIKIIIEATEIDL